MFLCACARVRVKADDTRSKIFLSPSPSLPTVFILYAEGKSTYKYIDFAFNSLTPGGREVERNGCIKVSPLNP